MAGGQWPQTRKASVPHWNIKDQNCQLCHKALGTIEHRFECEKTRPTEGWAGIPSELQEKVKALGEDRYRTLKTKGLVCVKVPTYKKYPDGIFIWLSAEPDTTRTVVTWYTDGSSGNPTCPELSRMGFAVVVVSDSGELIAFGAGIPPSHVTDSGMAEAWALWKVIEMCPHTPRIVTDCLTLLNVAECGTALATNGRSPNARIWRLIARAMDGDVTKLKDCLVWMPAHQSTAAISCRYKSNGHRLNSMDYRANRLVDKLAGYRIKKNYHVRKGEQISKRHKESSQERPGDAWPGYVGGEQPQRSVC